MAQTVHDELAQINNLFPKVGLVTGESKDVDIKETAAGWGSGRIDALVTTSNGIVGNE